MASELKPCPFCGKAMMLRGALWPSEGDTDAVIHAEPTECPMYDFCDGTADGSIVERWNTRPAPAATDTGLETVGGEYLDGHTWKPMPAGVTDFALRGFKTRGLVTRSQAEELLAAERAENARLKLENEAQADQIDELQMTPWPEWASEVLAVIRKRSGYDGYDDAIEGVDLTAELDECMSELEAKLTAAEKELGTYKAVVKDVCESQRGTKWGKCAECIFDAIERAALGGKKP